MVRDQIFAISKIRIRQKKPKTTIIAGVNCGGFTRHFPLSPLPPPKKKAKKRCTYQFIFSCLNMIWIKICFNECPDLQHCVHTTQYRGANVRSISSSPSLQNLAQRLQSFPNNPVTIHQLRKSFLLAVGEGKGEGGGCMVSLLCSFVRICNFINP